MTHIYYINLIDDLVGRNHRCRRIRGTQSDKIEKNIEIRNQNSKRTKFRELTQHSQRNFHNRFVEELIKRNILLNWKYLENRNS